MGIECSDRKKERLAYVNSDASNFFTSGTGSQGVINSGRGRLVSSRVSSIGDWREARGAGPWLLRFVEAKIFLLFSSEPDERADGLTQ